MKFIVDFVSVVLSVCVVCVTFIYVAPIINQQTTPQQETTYPSQIRETLYIDRTFTESERASIIEAARAWNDATKGIVQYKIVQLPSHEPIVFENSLFIVKISPDDPEVLFMNNEDNILGHYTSRQGISTIGIVDGRIENKKFKSVIMHEIGHALGLKHQSADEDVGTIMYPYMQISIGMLIVDVSSDKITKTDLTQFCQLYHCNVDDLLK